MKLVVDTKLVKALPGGCPPTVGMEVGARVCVEAGGVVGDAVEEGVGPGVWVDGAAVGVGQALNGVPQRLVESS